MTGTKTRADAAWPHLHEAQRTVLLEVLIHGSRTRADLARRTGLSRATLMRLTRGLVELGLVTEGEAQVRNGRGRPSETVHLRPESAHFVGVKLTGDALYAAVTDLHANVVATEERPLPSRNVEDVVELIADVILGLNASHPLTAAGVCLAGDVKHTGGHSIIVGSHFLGWDNVLLGDLVQSRTGLPTAISNDVQALTVAHHWFGAGVGCESLALIGIGAGIGTGLVVNGQLVGGSRGHPGKVGHLLVTDDGPVCDRGHVGCVSAFVTIPAILRNAGTTGFWETLEAAGAGDARSGLAIRQAGTALGVVIANIADLIDPEKVIVTGESLALARYARAEVDEAIAARLDPASEPVAVELIDFHFGDYAWAAAIGAIRQVI